MARTPYERQPRGGSDAWDDGPAGAVLVEGFFGAPAPPGAGTVKVYLAGSWQAKPVKVWDGATWVTKPLKRWSGSAWV